MPKSGAEKGGFFLFHFLMIPEITAIIGAVLDFLKNIWWIWTPYVLFLIFWGMWRVYLNIYFFSRVTWTLLEIRIPLEVGKPPQAMEQVFAGLHSIRRGFNMLETYWEGKMYLWFSCEIVGRGGAISFFIYTPSVFKNFVEAQIYAQYPESEIKEVPDYTEELPSDIPNDEWSAYGFELTLQKPDAYPIRTYKEFAIQDVQYEEQKVDPLASLAEALSQLKPGEHVWIQILIRPTQNDSWKEQGRELVDKLIGRKKAKKKTTWDEITEELKIYGGLLYSALFGGASSEPSREERPDLTTLMQSLSPGEKDVVTAIERNISKLGFDTAIRVLYIARKDVFQPANIAAISGAFNQFNDLALNGFKRVNGTSVDYFFTTSRELHLKRSLILKYKLRERPGPAYTFTAADHIFKLMKPYKKSLFVFNIEELATIFHIPGGVVTTTSLPRVEAKKGAPPINLPLD